jgi:acyl-CoA thioester hydrolase
MKICRKPEAESRISALESAPSRDISETVATRHAVRPGDLDSLRHVNNATVLEYLEHGRWAWLTHFGIDKGRRIVPVVTRITVDYLREIFLCEFAIQTMLAGETFYRVVLEQSIEVGLNNERQTAVKALVHIGFIDSQSRRPRRLKDFLEENLR